MPNSALKHVAIFGGTFCPIHRGHIEIALFLENYFHFDAFFFVPNKAPLLDKKSTATVEQRIEMLRLALAPYPFFQIDLRETKRSSPSFMVETLQSFREEFGDLNAISLIIGMDSFKQFQRWHDWQTILKLCNLIVIERPEQTPIHIANIEEITNPKLLTTPKRGGVFHCNAGKFPISSTKIRELIANGEDVSAFISPQVLQYIQDKNLFKNNQ